MNNVYAGPASSYLHMRFNKPKTTCRYVKMLDYIEQQNYVFGYFPTRKEVQAAAGLSCKHNNTYSDWQYLQAMMENNLIVNVGYKNYHNYVITKKGQKLLLAVK